MATTRHNTEHRVSVLLNLLGPSVSDAVLKELPASRQSRLKQRLGELAQSPPSDREMVEVLRELDRLMRFAAGTTPSTDKSEASAPAHLRLSEATAELPDDPFEAINRVSETRLVATLRDEAPRTVAVVLSCLDESKAARVLDQLPTDRRDAVVMQLKERLTPPLALLTRLLRATLAKCESFVERELAAERVSSDARVAKLVRTMEPQRRGEVLQMLEGADPDACERIRDLLFAFDDLLIVEDQTMQRILGEIDTRVLSLALTSAAEEIQERVLSNLSKRARESLLEEISLIGSSKRSETDEAQKAIVKTMIELDRVGELMMKTG